jgi:hypothetical protein
MGAELLVEVRGTQIIVTRPGTDFRATYEKPSNQPHLVMVSARIEPNASTELVFAFRSLAFRAAVDRARELGWIV